LPGAETATLSNPRAFSRLAPGTERPEASLQTVLREFESSSKQVRKGYETGNYVDVDRELGTIRARADTMVGRLRGLPLEQRLKVFAISSMYLEGASLVEEGRNAEQESKVRMGFEKIEEASSRLEELQSNN
jgi:hypothetical protein